MKILILFPVHSEYISERISECADKLIRYDRVTRRFIMHIKLNKIFNFIYVITL